MTDKSKIIGHLAAVFTIIIWGTTFISTKILLEGFLPVEILFFRFVIGYTALLLLYPKKLKVTNRKHEPVFVFAGLCGICLYYLLENIALTFTFASNVGVIMSTAPFFTAILSHLFFISEEKLRLRFFIGFVCAMVGIIFISYNGMKFTLDPLGDFLALSAALVWACYSLLVRKISKMGYPVFLSTRRTFFYGIIFMIPAAWFSDFRLDLFRFTHSIYLFNMIFLGLGASAFCFVTWNFAVRELGTVKTSVYIYLVPVITVFTSALVLKERLTALMGIGAALTLAGLILSEQKAGKK
ncbi:DMT family transporter [Taurinivorans muris]|uniref:DMT family transporter n=1 Tax=Taurinivorans muris TaxID=2787751 RepID=A0ABY5Y0I1_9BACT|nr:DMT family transporter [Desulfovibrionaceae bacterium LT0009]